MDQNNLYGNGTYIEEAEENVALGVLGAFLFSLAGGVLYIILGMVGFIAALSGYVGVVCAIKGYSLFAKKESKKGIIISVIITALVLVIAWYVGFCLDVVRAFQEAYEAGEIFVVPITFWEYLPVGFYDLTLVPEYFIDLALSLGLGVFGAWSYVSNMLKKQKAQEAQRLAQEQQTYGSTFQNEEQYNNSDWQNPNQQ